MVFKIHKTIYISLSWFIMFYNRITKVWVIDPIDIFLVSAFLGSTLASYLKDYHSDKKAMERLKNSMIKKSKLVRQSGTNYKKRKISKKRKIQKIYKLALQNPNRGGQFEGFQGDYQFSDEAFNLAQKIRGFAERLARFLKERELQGVGRIFFRNGRLVLELILAKCQIDITYSLVTPGLSTQLIVMTFTTGGATGFVLSWFSFGATLVAPPTLVALFLLRGFSQQIINQQKYKEFKEMLQEALEDEKIQETLRLIFGEREASPSSPSPRMEMKPVNPDKNPLPEFDSVSHQTLEDFIKAKMQKELGLVENPSPKQIEEIIKTRKIQNKLKGKTVYFKDFINKIAEDSDDFIDTEIVKEAVKVKIKNQEF